MADQYEWSEMAMGFQVSDPALIPKKSRFIWAWQRKAFLRMGWTVDGGIWPRLRITKPLELEDYLYGEGMTTKLQGLDAVLYSDGTANSYGGIDRGSAPIWGNKNG